MSQLDLFGAPPVHTRYRRKSHDTEREAATAVHPKINKIQKVVMAYATACGPHGFTLRELEQHFLDLGSSHRSRVSELVTLGLIVDTGRRRKLGRGRHHIVWAVR